MLPTAAGSPVSFVPWVTPSIVKTNSPNYVHQGVRVTPDDDNLFMETYTWSQFQLTLAATGSPPLTTGVPKPSGTDLPELPCMVTPGPASPFVSCSPSPHPPSRRRAGAVSSYNQLVRLCGSCGRSCRSVLFNDMTAS